jgi:uncharacterized repeat protein (TIGR03803 family)
LVFFPANQTSSTALTQGTNGCFYGTTGNGGTNGLGAVFMVIPASGTNAAALTNLVSFNNTNGSTPTGPLLREADGCFYGTTTTGGNTSTVVGVTAFGGGGGGGGSRGSGSTSGNGTIFKMTHAGKLTTLALFYGTNGANPVGGLVKGPQGWFYGATSAGGANSKGSVFAWSPTLGVSNLYSFKGTDGSNPQGGLVVGLDGNLYGTTFQGGTDGLGTVFKLSPSNTLTTLASFALNNGAFPWGMVQTANSNLFGATAYGGTNDVGSVFEVTPSGQLSSLLSFNIANGSDPVAPLLLGRDGNLYGTTLQGGTAGEGVVFRAGTTFGTGSNLVSFQGANGEYPKAGLMQASNGNFYGTTTGGGANGSGTVFELFGFPPSIFQQPASTNYAAKGTADFSVGATGSGPLSYQWVFYGNSLSNAGSISGATNSVLKIDPETLADAGSYAVIVTNSYGTATSSVVTLTVPTPTLTITSPKAGATVTTPTLVVAGTAKDKYDIGSVMFQFGSGTNWTEAKSTNQWTNWTATVELQPGSNVFQAYSVDPLGNHSATQSVEVFYSTKSPLTLLTSGFGTIQRSFTGTNLEVGKNYTVTARPMANNLFVNWTGGITPTTNNPLTFLMVSNLTLTANFETNSYLYAAGNYNGLFFVSNSVGAQSSGLIKNLQVGKVGRYTGAIYIGGTNYSISGNFDASGNASNQITRAGNLGSLTLLMNLDWSTKPPLVTGSVSGKNGGAWAATLMAEKAGGGLGSAEYTMLIPPGTNAPLASPIGNGYAVVTNHSGTVTLTGALADGTGFSQNVAEAESGDLAVYASPYSSGGLLLGWLSLTNGSPEGSLTWIKPATSSGLYTNGFTNTVAVQSSVWSEPTTNTVINYLPPLSAELLEVSGAFLASPISFDVTLNYQDWDVTANNSGVTNSFSSTTNPKTGLFSIIFGNGNGTQTTKGIGVLLQNDSLGGGYFVTSTNAGAFTLEGISANPASFK